MVLAAGSLALAQSNPFVGTWKLNIAASKFEPGPPPQSQSRTWDADGSVNITGVNAAGKSTGYSYTINGDGKEYPTLGSIPNGVRHDLLQKSERQQDDGELHEGREGSGIDDVHGLQGWKDAGDRGQGNPARWQDAE